MERHVNNPLIVDSLTRTRLRQLPAWLSLDPEKAEGSLVSIPSRGEIDTQISEQLIVEFYSK